MCFSVSRILEPVFCGMTLQFNSHPTPLSSSSHFASDVDHDVDLQVSWRNRYEHDADVLFVNLFVNATSNLKQHVPVPSHRKWNSHTGALQPLEVASLDESPHCSNVWQCWKNSPALPCNKLSANFVLSLSGNPSSVGCHLL